MENLVTRRDYMKMLRDSRGLTDVIKVVTGMRRSGKSTLLEMYRDELVSNGVAPADIISINFETFEFRDVRDRQELDRILQDAIGDSGTKYVFLDEIQNVSGWEESLSSLVNTRRCDVYITGSNSKLLSSDLTTHIAGRFIEIPVLPLSFSEYMELHQGDVTERFNQYLRYGSLPEIDPDRGDRVCISQLQGIFNTVLVNDIIQRLSSNNGNMLIDIARFLYTNIGNETSLDSIARTLNISNDTVKRYLSKMEEAFLFYRSERYDIIGKKVLKTNGKFYASDIGLRNVALFGAGGTDISRPLENIVYLELLRRGYIVRTGCYRDREVDFTAIRGGKTEYYQVCLTMLSEETREREIRSLRSIDDNFRKTVLTLDRFGLGDDGGISLVNVIDWLLREDGIAPSDSGSERPGPTGTRRRSCLPPSSHRRPSGTGRPIP